MKFLVRAFLLAALAAHAAAMRDLVTPMQKIIQLLGNMKEKGQKEIQEEKVAFAKFSQFVELSLSKKQKEIQEGADKIEALSADIEKAAATSERLSTEIEGHQASIAEAELQKENATEIRKTEAADYLVLHKDLGESVDALDRAIKLLKKQDFDRPQANKSNATDAGEGLLQLPQAQAVSFAEISDADWQLAGKALEYANALEKQLPTPPPVDAYEFQSGGVIDMLSNLQEKFVKEKRSVEDAEMQKKQAYEMLMGSLKIEIDQHQTAMEKKTTFKNAADADKTAAENTRSEVITEKAADQKYHDDLSTEFRTKSADFAERQKVRAAEVEAVDKAVEILKGASFVQRATTKGTALAFLGARKPGTDKVLHFLQQRASELHSRSLDRLLLQVQSKQAPTAAGAMQNIAKMLKDLLTKLQEDQMKETDQKAWCNEELSTNALTRDAKTEEVASLKSEIDLLQTSIAKLAEDNSVLAGDITNLASEIEKATALREEEKAANAKKIKEATETKSAVEAAMSVLQSFYEDMGPALLQMRKSKSVEDPTKPEFAAGSYSDNGQSNIIGFFQVIIADFNQEIAETKVSEEAAYKEYREFISDSKADKMEKETIKRRNEMKSKEQGTALTERQRDLASTEKQLDAAVAYFDELKPKCIDTSISYEEQVKRREEEIASLQKALEMLSDSYAR
eukprot:gb/GFBE01031218.1/.p1 GENE.gb/GFBE01031218.1/~~gb/GFBE01031218.1/.p1  ORF type:complete len:683 (+),score=280.61 gb/GFBE01031218.1/:1-2049(+)